MLLDRSVLERLTIELPEKSGPCLRFAAEELRRYLHRLGGSEPGQRVASQLPPDTLRLGDGPQVTTPASPDAYHIAAAHRGVTVAGANERAVLHAVYRLLEDAGCVWSFHGREREIAPPLPPEGVRLVDRREEPPYHVRAYATDIHTHHYKEPAVMAERMPADLAFVDWMGKTAANAFLFIRHPFDSELTIAELVPEFRKRGIAPEYGGHVLPLLLPREEFAAHPDWFPTDPQGRRTDLGNLCTSSREALATVAKAAVGYVERHPEMEVLHIWGADLWDGGWCHCSSCAVVSVQDQNLRVCNAVAAALESAGLPQTVCYLAYHDTIEPDLHLDPHQRVVAEYAPRERCYGHALDDPDCNVNLRYREAFEKHVDRFEGRLRVFEYYGDAILFCGIAVPLTAVIAADLDYYRRAGAREISFLQFGAYSLWAHPLNFCEFAARSARAEPASIATVGAAYPTEFWREIEEAIATIVTYGDVRRPPRKRAAAILPRLEAAAVLLRGWAARLDDDPEFQRPLLEYTASVLEGIALQLAGTATGIEEGEARFQRALDIVARAPASLSGVWGRRNLPVIHSFHSAAVRRS